MEGLADTPFRASTEALFSEELPEHLIVIGSSVVAVEVAQAYRRLGSEVTILVRHTLFYSEDSVLEKACRNPLNRMRSWFLIIRNITDYTRC